MNQIFSYGHSSNVVAMESPDPHYKIKNMIHRMVINHHPMENLDDRDIQDIFCDQCDEGRSFLEIAVQVRNLDAVHLLKEYESVFMPQLPQFLLNDCELFLRIENRVRLTAHRNFMITLCDDEIVASKAIMQCFLLKHSSSQSKAATNFYLDLFATLKQRYIIHSIEVLERRERGREWYYHIVGVPIEEITPHSLGCTIQ